MNSLQPHLPSHPVSADREVPHLRPHWAWRDFPWRAGACLLLQIDIAAMLCFLLLSVFHTQHEWVGLAFVLSLAAFSILQDGAPPPPAFRLTRFDATTPPIEKSIGFLRLAQLMRNQVLVSELGMLKGRECRAASGRRTEIEEVDEHEGKCRHIMGLSECNVTAGGGTRRCAVHTALGQQLLVSACSADGCWIL